MSDTRQLTVEEAKSLLPDSKRIHVYSNSGMMLIGADWDRDSVLAEIEGNPKCIQIGGEMCRSMNHAIVVLSESGPWFISNDKQKLDELDPQDEH